MNRRVFEAVLFCVNLFVIAYAVRSLVMQGDWLMLAFLAAAVVTGLLWAFKGLK